MEKIQIYTLSGIKSHYTNLYAGTSCDEISEVRYFYDIGKFEISFINHITNYFLLDDWLANYIDFEVKLY